MRGRVRTQRFLSRSQLCALALVALLLASLGCAQGSPIHAWQHEIKHYIQQHGHGNPAALVDLAHEPTQRHFNRIGERRGLIAPTRTDTHGTLVGHHHVDGELWFIYLLAIVQDQGGILDVNFDRPVVQSIQPIAFTLDPAQGEFRWAVGEPDEHAMQRYLWQQRERWAQSYPDRRPEAMRYTRFPRPWDRFELTGAGRHVRIGHPDTGASWSLELRGALE